MTVGEESLWKRLVVVMPDIGSKPDKTPGLLQVAYSRCGKLSELAILEGPNSPLSRERLMRIGTTNAYNGRRAFEQRLRAKADDTLDEAFNILQPYADPQDPRNLDKIWESLCQWYHEELGKIVTHNT